MTDEYAIALKLCIAEQYVPLLFDWRFQPSAIHIALFSAIVGNEASVPKVPGRSSLNARSSNSGQFALSVRGFKKMHDLLTSRRQQ
jgi:hypothetical protein